MSGWSIGKSCGSLSVPDNGFDAGEATCDGILCVRDGMHGSGTSRGLSNEACRLLNEELQCGSVGRSPAAAGDLVRKYDWVCERWGRACGRREGPGPVRERGRKTRRVSRGARSRPRVRENDTDDQMVWTHV